MPRSDRTRWPGQRPSCVPWPPPAYTTATSSRLPRSCPAPCAIWASKCATELDPAEAGAYGQILAERLDPQRFPTMAAVATGPTFDDDGDVTPMVRFGLSRLLDGIDSYTKGKSNG